MVKAIYNGIELPPLPKDAGPYCAIFDYADGAYILASTSMPFIALQRLGYEAVMDAMSQYRLWFGTIDERNLYYLDWVPLQWSPGAEVSQGDVIVFEGPLVWCNVSIRDEAGTVRHESSDPFEIRRAQRPIIIRDLGGSYTFNKGQATGWATVSALVGDGGTLTYQWLRRKTENVVTPEIPGATSPSFSPPSDEVGTWHYYCKVTNTWEGLSEWNFTGEVTVVIVDNDPGGGGGGDPGGDTPTQPDDPEYVNRKLSIQVGIVVGLACRGWPLAAPQSTTEQEVV